jgi:hypothetical protein
VHDACQSLVDRGVPAATIEELDLSAVVRARDQTPPDGAEQVEEIRARTLELLEELA